MVLGLRGLPMLFPRSLGLEFSQRLTYCRQVIASDEVKRNFQRLYTRVGPVGDAGSLPFMCVVKNVSHLL